MPFQKGNTLGKDASHARKAKAAAPAQGSSDEAMGRLISVMEGLSARLSSLEAQAQRPAAQEGPSTFGSAPPPLMAMKNISAEALKGGMMTTGNIPVGADGNPLSDHFLRMRQPRFAPRSRVRLNLDVVAHGHTKTYREIIAALPKPPALVGEVLRGPNYRDGAEDFKYFVAFDGMGKPKGDGYYERELLPA